MKPIAIFQHNADVEPGYFTTWLTAHALPFTLVRIDRGDAVPADPGAFAGLCFMGGRMSVNDPLPWIDDECALIRAADAARVPVIGHCLGGQLIAKALGGCVRRNPVKEIGWRSAAVTAADVARHWLGPEAPSQVQLFQWHGDTFDPPPGAVNFLASDLCAHQAYVVQRDGYAHLGMQFHCEMTPALVRDWAQSEDGREEVAEEQRVTGGPGVQSAETMLQSVEARTAQLNALAARLYQRWSQGLRVD